MSSPLARPQVQSEDAVAAALVIVLLSGLPLATTASHALPLLASLGIEPQAASQALSLVYPQIDPASRVPVRPVLRTPERDPETGRLQLPAPEPRTPAQAHVRTTEVPRHSRYLVAAARRFQMAQSQEEGQAIMQRERRYLAQHLNALRYTREAAQRVDRAVARHGLVLGWWAHMDERTTAECRAANGANFSAANPPLIGYPGTLHGGTCRCHAGPAHKTSLTVDQATAALRANAVLPFATELSQR